MNGCFVAVCLSLHGDGLSCTVGDGAAGVVDPVFGLFARQARVNIVSVVVFDVFGVGRGRPVPRVVWLVVDFLVVIIDVNGYRAVFVGPDRIRTVILSAGIVGVCGGGLGLQILPPFDIIVIGS